MAELARPVFDSGPRDPVSIIDVYNVVDPEVRNNLTSKLSSFGNSLTESFNTAMRGASDIGNKIKAGKIDLAEATRRVKGALSGSRGDIVNLASSVQNSIFSELTGTLPGTDYVRGATELFDSVQIAVGQGTYLFKQGGISSIQSTLGFISDLTGNPVFKALDLGAEAALVKGLLGEVSSWGIPSLVDELLGGRDYDFQHSVVSRAAGSVLQVSDINMLEYYVNKGLSSALTNQTPDFAEQFLSQYTFPQETTPEQYPTLHAQLFNVMDNLKPTWFYTHRGTVTSSDGQQTVITPTRVINLGILARISQDAHTLLASDPTTRPAVLCAKNFPSTDLVQLARKTYPLVAIHQR